MTHKSTMYWRRLGSAGLLALLAGCSSLDIPRADNYPATDQKKVRAVHHWDVLADDVAGRIDGKIKAWPAGEYPIYVASPAIDTSFNNSFRKLLITRLLDRGVILSTEPTAVTLVFEAQVVQHPASASYGLPMPGMPLALGVGVARDAYSLRQNSGAVWADAAASGAPADINQYATDGTASGGLTRTEVLITTSLESAGRYLASTADVYYVAQDDSVLYKMKTLPPAVLPTPVKNWQVVAP